MTVEKNAAVLLTPEEMRVADRLTTERGTTGIDLMEQAGAAVAEAALARYPSLLRVSCLVGPGNNGGDAFVAARLLKQDGRAVRIHSLGDRSTLKGDAAIAAARFAGDVEPIETFDPDNADLVIDGLFGAGLSHPLDTSIAKIVDRANDCRTPVLAIDLPSGVSGVTGEVMGSAIRATTTVTFFRRKPGHLLQPGRDHCGEIVVAQIGIDPSVLDTIASKLSANEPETWRAAFPKLSNVGHKYDRGHAVVFSGGATTTGAARMSAVAALRIGAGLVTVFSPASALLINAAHLTGVMLHRCDDAAELDELLRDKRLDGFVIGPGFGIGEKARIFVQALLAAGRSLVIDADAISSFKDDAATLFDAVRDGQGSAVMTPHAGEFARLFPDVAKLDISKVEKARQAAEQSGGVIVLKGSDTVIAAPDGRAAINATGSPHLATAGTGDVLAGMIGGLLAQRMAAFEAACAAVWMHGTAGAILGSGLIAEDLPSAIPAVLKQLRGER